MDFKVTEIVGEILGGIIGNAVIRKKYKVERIETAKDINGNDVQILVLEREYSKEAVQGEINRITAQREQFAERKTMLEEILTEIENLEKE